MKQKPSQTSRDESQFLQFASVFKPQHGQKLFYIDLKVFESRLVRGMNKNHLQVIFILREWVMGELLLRFEIGFLTLRDQDGVFPNDFFAKNVRGAFPWFLRKI